MIIHKLISHHLKNADDPEFYLLQARDAISWIEKAGVVLNAKSKILDLGCGHGIFGSELLKKGCQVSFADQQNYLEPNLKSLPFLSFDIDRDPFETLGQFDLVIASNVYEHLSQPKRLLCNLHKLLTPNGRFYLSWTNWLSPWGGHEFSPFHYFGPRLGPKLFDKILKRPRNHTPFVNLFPTYIGETLHFISRHTDVKVVDGAPRYYPELKILIHLPILREFFTWNCALLLAKKQ